MAKIRLVKMKSWLWKPWPSDVFDDLPIKSGDFNSFNSYVSVPEGRYKDVEFLHPLAEIIFHNAQYDVNDSGKKWPFGETLHDTTT